MPFPYLIDFYMEKYCAFRRKKMLYTFLQFSRIFQIFKQYFFWRCIRINFIDFFWTTSNTYFRLIYQLSKNIQKYLWNSKEISQCTASWVPHIFASDLKKTGKILRGFLNEFLMYLLKTKPLRNTSGEI